MAGLAVALAKKGVDVVFVAEELMSKERTEQGWLIADLNGVHLKLIHCINDVMELVALAPKNSIHICQGIRRNGMIGVAQLALAVRGLRQWIVMETIEDEGWRGFVKKLEYRRLFMKWRDRIEGVLATGYRTTGWVAARGMSVNSVFPFAYFLPANSY